MAPENTEATVEELFRQGSWFVVAFIGLMVLFFVLQPVFVQDLIEPFWDFFGLHNAWSGAMELIGVFWQEFGLFLVFLVAVFLFWTISQKKPAAKKAEKK